jgi:hypothetical protein
VAWIDAMHLIRWTSGSPTALGRCGSPCRRAARGYSSLTPEAFTTFAHFAISERM